jgi:hypothetical protein
MGLWSRLIRRNRGMLADESTDEDAESPPVLHAPLPTPSTRRIERPPDTAGSPHFDGPHPTAGTPTYRTPGGTPSTRRIHNPSHPGGR